jgi:hypothetical protein
MINGNRFNKKDMEEALTLKMNKRRKKMKKLVFVVVSFLLVAGVALAKDFEVTKKAGDYTVTAKIDRNPPVTGENNLTVIVNDAAGAAVKDAKVSVDYSMPAMPGMPAMKYAADTVSKGDEYQAKLNFSMSGAWDVALRITQGKKKVQAKFNVDVR